MTNTSLSLQHLSLSLSHSSTLLSSLRLMVRRMLTDQSSGPAGECSHSNTEPAQTFQQLLTVNLHHHVQHPGVEHHLLQEVSSTIFM